MTYDFDTPRPRACAGWAKWDSARAAGCPADITPLTVADMEFATAPEIVEAVAEAAAGGLWGYTYADEDFRAAVAGWMRENNGWAPKPEWLVGTPGVVYALYAAVRAFTKPGEGVLIQPPVYSPFFSAAEANGRTVVENPLIRGEDGRYTIDFEDLRRKAKSAKLMVLCSPHNPVGRVWAAEELRQVADICLENGLILFSDEIHCDIVMPGHGFTSLGGLGGDILNRCLIGTSASKTFSLAGLSCSSIFMPGEELRGRFEAQMAADGVGFNTTFGVAATKAACRRGRPWMLAMRAKVAENYAWLAGFVAENLPAHALAPLEGTYLAWLDLRPLGMEEEALTAFLREKACFYANAGGMFGPGGAGFVRLNIACPTPVLRQAMQRLLQALRQAGLA